MTRCKKFFKKRKFLLSGNRFTKEIDQSASTPIETESSPSSPSPTENSNDFRPTTSSLSSKAKVTPSLLLYDKDDDFEFNIIDLKKLSSTLDNIAVCKECHCKLEINIKHIAGLACEIIFQCVNCDNSATTKNCEVLETKIGETNTKLYDLNIRLVYAMRAIGKGRASVEKLCGVLNLSPPINLCHVHEKFLATASEIVCKKSMNQAVAEALTVNEGSKDISVAIDGSWQKRGHTSMNGVLSATSLDTGKVVDIDILSKFCSCGSKFVSTAPHEEKCSSNYHGSSGAMEVAGAVRIFQRSLDLYNVI